MIDLSRFRAAARCAALACAASLVSPAFASGTAVWEMNSYNDFIRGRFSGVSINRDGRLSLAPAMASLLDSDQAVIWSMALGPDGAIYAGTGHRGRVYKIDAAGRAALLWTAQQPEVFAVAVDRAGAVYAATSPDGAVYRIVNGKAEQFFAPQTRYIWSLALGQDGALYVGTGDAGKIFRVDAAGKGELYYNSGQSHITGLAVDAQGRLLAGTEPNGILYRITAKDRGFVLYDAALPEIRSILPMPDGTVYVAALGGSVAKQEQAAKDAVANPATGIPTLTTSITVTAQASEIKPPDPSKPQAQSPVPGAPAQPALAAATAVDTSNVDKSAVYRINADNTVETLWSSKEENVYDLLALNQQVLFATDAAGRIYGLAPDRRVALLAETNEGETTRLLPARGSVLAATGNAGRIFRLGETPGPSGWLESPVHDAGAVSRWGSLSWRGDSPAGSSAAFRTRSGNSERPDATWSDWSAPLTAASGSPITSPNARYLQWRVEMTGTATAAPVVNSVTAAYLPQNSPPILRSINISAQAAPAGSTGGSASSSAYTVTVTDTGAVPSTPAVSPTQVLSRAAANQIVVIWQADDPEGDRLVYDLYFRGDDETQWKAIKTAIHENSALFDADMFADGKYYFRVTASDKEANPPSTARESELISSPMFVDNTPPVVTPGTARRTGASAHVEFEAADSASPLRRCEYSLDAATWVPVESADGVIDSLREKFSLDLAGMAAGERMLVIRAVDSAGNSGVAKVALK